MLSLPTESATVAPSQQVSLDYLFDFPILDHLQIAQATLRAVQIAHLERAGDLQAFEHPGRFWH
jgi:hypothetical protein